MPFTEALKKFWNFLKQDTWPSFFVSLILIILIIKLVFFPLLSLMLNTPLPLVVVESCSMYHAVSFDGWWERNADWYEKENISHATFAAFPFRNGLNKGDIILVTGLGSYQQGDVIIFTAETRYPIIHRLVHEQPRATKGDNNPDQLPFEHAISEKVLIGKAVARVPLLGWLKLIFFEPLKTPEQRGFCHVS